MYRPFLASTTQKVRGCDARIALLPSSDFGLTMRTTAEATLKNAAPSPCMSVNTSAIAEADQFTEAIPVVHGVAQRILRTSSRPSSTCNSASNWFTHCPPSGYGYLYVAEHMIMGHISLLVSPHFRRTSTVPIPLFRRGCASSRTAACTLFMSHP